MNNPTVDDVRLLVTTPLNDAQLTALINDAATMVAPCSLGIDCATKKTIIKYVVAHMMSLMPGGPKTLTQRSLGDASESYASVTLGTNLAGSAFGQMALSLDPTGCLANLGKRRGWAKTL